MKILSRESGLSKMNIVKKMLLIMMIVLLAGLLSACHSKKQETAVPDKDLTINGAGATFPYPLYSRWANRYEKITRIRINYQSIGSGGGIAQAKASTVDFGASDAPLKKGTLDKAGLIQFPMVIGGIVPVVHLEGIQPGALRFTPKILSDIYLGHLKKWNDPEIGQVNPDVELPDLAITPIHRADGSGTTWIFTNYLSKISWEWEKQVGNAIAVSWPAGVGGKGNEGVSAYIQRINGAVGYVAYAYALQNKMTWVQMQNQAGEFVFPGLQSFRAAMHNAHWEEEADFYIVLTDQPGKESWPIVGPSFILFHRENSDAQKTAEMLSFFQWCYVNGAEIAEQLNYVALPAKVIDLVEQRWAENIRVNGQPAWPLKSQ